MINDKKRVSVGVVHTHTHTDNFLKAQKVGGDM